MKLVTERFIRNVYFPPNMVKDSELVREVEEFLKEHNIKKYVIKYDRGVEFTQHENHPAFEIETKNLKALKNLAEKLKMPLQEDLYRLHRHLTIQNDKYNLYIYNKIFYRNPFAIR